ncbi:uncharacterized protein LY89DRAFT_672268 [Mollisia scopiformis]|uniref:Uncharacterized protein n=1 Tax=Mollisia scopiformis TaxID=149040 RepID=A0A194X1C8_MOLSC|nr:uncharacterized protein LY89DRAFT_672268 [Mollisia scopiformis]KUJ14001.1 hypothetical protein LY89DRAFT_672268 [Mollisia scopiformis]
MSVVALLAIFLPLAFKALEKLWGRYSSITGQSRNLRWICAKIKKWELTLKLIRNYHYVAGIDPNVVEILKRRLTSATNYMEQMEESMENREKASWFKKTKYLISDANSIEVNICSEMITWYLNDFTELTEHYQRQKIPRPEFGVVDIKFAQVPIPNRVLTGYLRTAIPAASSGQSSRQGTSQNTRSQGLTSDNASGGNIQSISTTSSTPTPSRLTPSPSLSRQCSSQKTSRDTRSQNVTLQNVSTNFSPSTTITSPTPISTITPIESQSLSMPTSTQSTSSSIESQARPVQITASQARSTKITSSASTQVTTSGQSQALSVLTSSQQSSRPIPSSVKDLTSVDP